MQLFGCLAHLKITIVMQQLLEINSAQVQDPNLENYIFGLRKKYKLEGKICLIQSPSFSFEAFSAEVARKQGYYCYPPTGLQCLQAALAEQGIEIEILDLNYKILENVCLSSDRDVNPSTILHKILNEYFANNQVAVVGVSAGVIVSNVFGVANHPFIQILKFLKDRESEVVLSGGVIATNEWKNILKQDLAHFVIDGEAENKIAVIIKSLFGEKLTTFYKGIHFKDKNQFFESQGNFDQVNFKSNLIPTYKNIPIEKYCQFGSLSPFSRMLGASTKFATIQLNRGCRGRCTFCGVIPFMGKGVRQYPLDLVYNEIEYLVKERAITHFEWLDDDLLRHRESLIELLQKIIDKNLKITWAANNGLIAAAIDAELLALMQESGCIGFRIGIESGNDQILKLIRKPASKQNLLASSQLFKQFPDQIVVGCYIIGFENESYRQILDTFQFSIKMDLAWNGFSIFQILRDSANATEEFSESTKTENSKKYEFIKTSNSDHLANYEKIINFVPSKENKSGVIQTKNKFNIVEFFSKNLEQVHDRAYLDEIWFGFNLISNYICNRNLSQNANPERFAQWLESLQHTHPHNPLMSLFLSLTYILLDQVELAQMQIDLTKNLLKNSAYWQGRFEQYYLQNLVWEEIPSKDFVNQELSILRSKFATILQ